ncbi:MAG: NAD(P)H-quinone oxidoreductase [Burkholderiales bacterium]
MIPSTMKQIEHGAGGAPAVMKIADAQVPSPRPGEVLIEVEYAGVNRPDVAQRKGEYPPPPGASPVMGLEVAGRIVAIAPDVTQWRVGDAVCALTPGGGYAEYCAVPAPHCLPIPRGLSVLEAAAIPETYFTVWTNVFDRGALKRGESLLVHGGSSGIGITAIQLAKAFGAKVFTTVGNDEKAAACKKLGADVAFNYKTEDWAKELFTTTEKRGVDVILDMVGGSYTNKNLRSLAPNGRLVQIAFLEGQKVEIELAPIMMKRLNVTGSTLRPRTIPEKAAIAKALFDNVWPLLEKGVAKPVIFKVFPLGEAAMAHALMESSTHIGKIMLEVHRA